MHGRSIGKLGVFALLLAAACLLAPPASGEEKIGGAFGVRFGDRFEPDVAAETASLNEDIPLYQFAPEETLPYFTKYYVEITPTTHMVYSIWGYGPEKGHEVCRNEQAELMDTLEGRYGAARKRFFFAPPENTRRIDQRERDVIVRCTGHNDSRLLVRYTDRRLQKKADAERGARR